MDNKEDNLSNLLKKTIKAILNAQYSLIIIVKNTVELFSVREISTYFSHHSLN